MFNQAIYNAIGEFTVEQVPVTQIATQVATPFYAYSLPRAVGNYRRIVAAYAPLGRVHVHYSAKANANLALLRALAQAGAGIDAVSAGEIHKALQAGVAASEIVFAGVGKAPDEIRYALEQGVGWFNVENVAELDIINALAAGLGRRARVALRLNPEVTANTHPYIATGHGYAKFGLTAEVVAGLLARQAEYVALDVAGLHVHIGSQLGDTQGTVEAVEKALELIAPYENIKTLNVGGGLPVPYFAEQALPSAEAFAQALAPLVQGYEVLLEPGRSIIADAGVLVTRVLYLKQQAAQVMAIVDASMTELIRPALYEAHHEIIPVQRPTSDELHPTQVVGPVCESSDVLGRDRQLPALKAGDLLAILTAGAYGMVMASNYNARPRPAEVVVEGDGQTWRVARRRETWEDLLLTESHLA